MKENVKDEVKKTEAVEKQKNELFEDIDFEEQKLTRKRIKGRDGKYHEVFIDKEGNYYKTKPSTKKSKSAIKEVMIKTKKLNDYVSMDVAKDMSDKIFFREWNYDAVGNSVRTASRHKVPIPARKITIIPEKIDEYIDILQELKKQL